MRLRKAGVPEGTRVDILWHSTPSMTHHYSVVQIVELHPTLEKVKDDNYPIPDAHAASLKTRLAAKVACIEGLRHVEPGHDGLLPSLRGRDRWDDASFGVVLDARTDLVEIVPKLRAVRVPVRLGLRGHGQLLSRNKTEDAGSHATASV